MHEPARSDQPVDEPVSSGCGARTFGRPKGRGSPGP